MNRVQINPFLRQRAEALSAGIAIVRQILKDHTFPQGFTTKQIFALSQDYSAPPNFTPFVASMRCHGELPVPRPDHPIRSIRFLKTMILPSLEGCQEITTFSQSRSGAHPDPDLSNLRPIRRTQRFASGREFVWKAVPPEERRFPQKPKEKETFGIEVGVGADISHLNKRRQRTRVKKVAEAVLQLRGQMPFSKALSDISQIRIQPKQSR